MPTQKNKNRDSDEQERRRLQEYIFGLEEIKEQAESMARETEEIRRAQELLLAILGATAQGICLVKDGVVVWCNAVMSRMVLRPPQDMAPLSFAGLFEVPDACLAAQRSLADEVAPGGVVSFDDRLKTVDGRLTPCLISGRMLDEEDPSRGVLYTITDITERKLAEDALNRAHAELEERVEARTADLARELEERKKAEAALKSSEERYRTFMDRLPAPLVVYDVEGRVLYANPAFEEVFQWSQEEIRGKRIDFVPREFQEETVRAIRDMLGGTPVKNFETTRLTKDGRRLVVNVNTAPFYDRHGAQVGNLVLFRDVTELQIARELLEKSEQRHRMILESSADPMVVYEPDGSVLYFNRAFSQVFGWSLEECLGRKMDKFVPPENWPETRIMIDKVTRGECFEAQETRRFKKDGQAIPVSISGAPFRDADGRLAGNIVTIRDITKTKKLEAQLLQAQKMDAMGTLASGVAHEFNNILMSIRSQTQMLKQKHAPDQELAKYLNQVDDSTQRAADLVNTMLGFSRLETGQLAPVDLDQVLASVTRLLRRTLPPSITIQHSPEPSLLPVLGNANQLEQVVLNLALNARDAMPAGGAITLGVEHCQLDEEFCRARPWASPGPYLKVLVRDTGVGIGPAFLERVFEPFFTTKEPGKGTGLGLTVVYSVVKAHRGGITVESMSGAGTSFSVYLPAREQAGRPARPNLKEARRLGQGAGQRVLIVEDEASIREVTCEILSAQGYQVIEAEQGQAALEIFQRQIGLELPVELVILDLSMPVMDGRQCLELLLEVDPDIRVLVATGHVDAQHGRDDVLGRAWGLLRKPFDLATLVNKVAEALGEPS